MTTYAIYSGVDSLGIVGTVAPGIFAKEGRSQAFAYLNPSGQSGTPRHRLHAGRPRDADGSEASAAEVGVELLTVQISDKRALRSPI